MRKRKNNKYLLLLSLLLLITMGYALISTQLKMIGISNVDKQTWNVYWGVPTVTEGSVTTSAPTRTQDSGDPANTKLTWSVTLDLPGDYYEFTVDAVNEGTLDAMITGIDKTVTPTLPDYIKYEIEHYPTRAPLKENQILPKATVNGNTTTPTTETYRVKVYYDETAATATTINDMTANTTYTFEFGITYGQATDDAIIVTVLDIGDYFRLVPDVSTYTVLGTDTGYVDSTTGDPINQTIKPNELTLWRVIDINENGVDAVSEYVSTSNIIFAGVTGYQKYVNTMQTIAAQYAKSGYTTGTRMMGYNGQTPIIQDTTLFDGSVTDISELSNTSTPAATDDIGAEILNGVYGDTLYTRDVKLVGDLYKKEGSIYGYLGLAAYPPGVDYNIALNTKCYYLASRAYYNTTSLGSNPHSFAIRYIVINGSQGSKTMREYSYNNVNWSWSDGDRPSGIPVRPIITVKYDVIKNGGTGTREDPYTFE